jgi:hypothetical protein
MQNDKWSRVDDIRVGRGVLDVLGLEKHNRAQLMDHFVPRYGRSAVGAAYL